MNIGKKNHLLRLRNCNFNFTSYAIRSRRSEKPQTKNLVYNGPKLVMPQVPERKYINLRLQINSAGKVPKEMNEHNQISPNTQGNMTLRTRTS